MIQTCELRRTFVNNGTGREETVKQQRDHVINRNRELVVCKQIFFLLFGVLNQ